jgi:hypothetical protein
MPAESYWRLSRAPRYSVLFALPLLLAYEALAVAVDLGPTPVRNGADVLLKSLFVAIAGARGPQLFGAIIVLTGIVLVWRDRRGAGASGGWQGRIFALMTGEAIAWSLVTGPLMGIATGALLKRVGLSISLGGDQGISGLSELARVTLSLGAGIYEELVFRVILVSGIAWITMHLLGARERAADVVAVLLSALIFSAFHYIGPYGEAWALGSFTFRALAGLFFSVLYLTRGFGITAWTHALYDLWILA